MATWSAQTIQDIADSVGIQQLSPAITKDLSQDVDFRYRQIIGESIKFMRHGKRNTLTTQDISHALRVLDVEPMYGYETTRPVKYGAASLGPGQPVYYLEEEEVDFEKLINAPLPKVPREVSFTAHWMAIEGVQPAIPQNPTQADAGVRDSATKGATTANSISASAGNQERPSVKPLVKHILSKELQLYFEKVTNSLLDPSNDNLRQAALTSLRNDSGLHQLLPYFVQFVSEKVTHNLKNLFVLEQVLEVIHSLLENPDLFIEPYVASLIPPILTCLVGKRLGSSNDNDGTALPGHFSLRDKAAAILNLVTAKFADSSHTLKPRLMRTCLRNFLSNDAPVGTHYGALLALAAIGGKEAVRVLIMPNLKSFEQNVLDGKSEEGGEKAAEVKACYEAVGKVVRILSEEKVKNEDEMEEEVSDADRTELENFVGPGCAQEIQRVGGVQLVRKVLEVKNGK
ncbi:DUF1546-domain-containing protein [Ascobolus immersus RN42]|uniref:DUF1546-domain-containing protein n=1 Tax=Ascobolus immersus RN42 TaxID=1160509 RepID=A0A3N4IJ13_ASCIM|nr:DUF1546-domain-containing protein [Ascobolus immersus RN42]